MALGTHGHAATRPSLGLLFPLPHFSGQGLPRRYQKLLPPVISGNSTKQPFNPIGSWAPMHINANHPHTDFRECAPSIHRSIDPKIPCIHSNWIHHPETASVLNNARIPHPCQHCEPGIVLVCHWVPSPLAPWKTEESSWHPVSCSGVSSGMFFRIVWTWQPKTCVDDWYCFFLFSLSLSLFHPFLLALRTLPQGLPRPTGSPWIFWRVCPTASWPVSCWWASTCSYNRCPRTTSGQWPSSNQLRDPLASLHQQMDLVNWAVGRPT